MQQNLFVCHKDSLSEATNHAYSVINRKQDLPHLLFCYTLYNRVNKLFTMRSVGVASIQTEERSGGQLRRSGLPS